MMWCQLGEQFCSESGLKLPLAVGLKGSPASACARACEVRIRNRARASRRFRLYRVGTLATTAGSASARARMRVGGNRVQTSNLRKVLSVLLVVLGLAWSFPGVQPAYAEEGPPALPERSVTGAGGLAITAGNASAYRSIIVPELLPLVRAGRLEFEAIQKLHFDWRYEDSWYQNSALQQSLGAHGELGQLPKGQLGILPRSPLAAEDQLNEAQRRTIGNSLVWSSASVLWSMGAVSSNFELLFFPRDGATARESGAVTRGFQGKITRVYPGFLQEEDTTGQVFRELIEFTAPKPLDLLRWLSFRFIGEDEDVVWISSPAIGQARQLTGSNRADRLFPGAIAAEDVFGWSGKPELVLAQYDKSLSALTPFASHLPGSLVVEGNGCVGVSSSADPRVNLDVGRFSSAAPWLPTNWVWTPRTLHRVVLISNDPFSVVGRQVVYFEEQSLLPVIRVVYGRTGRYLKTIVTAFGIATATTTTQRRAWYPAMSLIEDDEAGQFIVVDYRGAQFCSSLTPSFQRAEFDPRKLAGVAKGESASTTIPAGNVAATPIPPSEASNDDD